MCCKPWLLWIDLFQSWVSFQIVCTHTIFAELIDVLNISLHQIIQPNSVCVAESGFFFFYVSEIAMDTTSRVRSKTSGISFIRPKKSINSFAGLTATEPNKDKNTLAWNQKIILIKMSLLEISFSKWQYCKQKFPQWQLNIIKH